MSVSVCMFALYTLRLTKFFIKEFYYYYYYYVAYDRTINFGGLYDSHIVSIGKIN